MSANSSVRHPPLMIYCNRCLCELKPFQDVPTTGGIRHSKCFWSNCKHVLCQTCRMSFTDQCSACNQKCQFIEISRKMPERYQFYFEPTIKLRQNLIGTVLFQQEQSTIIANRTISQIGTIQNKCRELAQTVKEIENTNQRKVIEKGKLMIIFDMICEEKKRRTAQQNELQQPVKERHRQHQPNSNRSPFLGNNFGTPFNAYDYGHGARRHLTPASAGARYQWTPGFERGFYATPRTEFDGFTNLPSGRSAGRASSPGFSS